MPKTNRFYFLFLGICIASLWLPFGFKISGVWEEWTRLYEYLGDSNIVANINRQYVRPLVFLTKYVGYLISPGSFVGLNIVLLTVLLLKAIAFFLFCDVVFKNKALAFWGALLFTLNPSDEGLMSIRITHIQLAIAFYFFAAYLFVKLVDQFNYRQAIFMALWIVLGLLSYEIALLVILITPLAWLLINPELSDNWKKASLVWFSTSIICGIFYSYASFIDTSSYQFKTLDSGIRKGNFIFDVFINYLRSIKENTWGGWMKFSDFDLQNIQVLIFIPLIIGIASYFFVYRKISKHIASNPPAHTRKRRLLGILLFGLVLFTLSIGIYLPTRLKSESFRVFMLSSSGIVIIYLGLLEYFIVNRIKHRVIVWILTISTFMVTLFAILKHQQTISYTIAYKNLITKFTNTFPTIKESTALIIIDESQTICSTDKTGIIQNRKVLDRTLKVLYGKEIHTYLGYPHDFSVKGGSIMSFSQNELVVINNWIQNGKNQDGKFGIDQLMIVKYTDDRNFELVENLETIYSLNPQFKAYSDYNPKKRFNKNGSPFDQFGYLSHPWIEINEPYRSKIRLQDSLFYDFHSELNSGFGFYKQNKIDLNLGRIGFKQKRTGIPLPLINGNYEINIGVLFPPKSKENIKERFRKKVKIFFNNVQINHSYNGNNLNLTIRKDQFVDKELFQYLQIQIGQNLFIDLKKYRDVNNCIWLDYVEVKPF